MKERSRKGLAWRKLSTLIGLPPRDEREEKIANKQNNVPPRERAIIANVRDQTT
tara:strand:+ start:1530 stop:1691 length:162 start_codon:yes stop_codon:yes gene_type:complete